MASIQQHSLQSRTNQMFDAWLKQSTAGTSTMVNTKEAQALLKQAATLPAKDVETLKAAFVAKAKADAFVASPEASKLFAEFFKIPLESIPVSGTKRTAVNSAQATRVANEADKSVKVPSKEVKELMRNLPKDMPGMVNFLGQQIMGVVKDGVAKLDPEGRKAITRLAATATAGATKEEAVTVADAFKDASSVLAKAARDRDGNVGKEMLADAVNRMEGNGGLSALDRALTMGVRPMSYVDYVAAHGGSFEDILFAFLMQLADNIDKKLEEKIKNMDKKERAQKSGSLAKDAAKVLADDTVDPETGRGGAARPASALDAKTARVSTVLESVVQSAHSSTSATSEGGAQITAKEATRLVGILDRLPPNVRPLLAASIATSMKAKGLPLQKEAFDSLVAWGNRVTGNKFDVGAYDPKVIASNRPKPDGALAQALENSGKIEDKIASYLVETLVDPGQSLKDKFKPFKEMRSELDRLGASPSSPQADAGAPAAKVAQTAPAAPVEVSAGEVENPENAQSDTMAQHELQRLIEDRKRIFQMLSDIMKSVADMIMNSVRNMRG